MRPADADVSATPIDLQPSSRPTLFVVVDTEEEFDWSKHFSRLATGVSAMRHIERVQRIFERFGVVPTYVIDYPVASQPEGVDSLAGYVESGRATIGAHLHPWVTPPDEEQVTRENSFPSNLPPALEAAKLSTLIETIEGVFGARPAIYKAGRYGIGGRTLRTLQELGFGVDMSVNPHMDYSSERGPDFRGFDERPWWLAGGALLEVPCTTGFAGISGPALGPRLHEIATAMPKAFHTVGLLARTRVTDRIMLTPEQSTLREMKLLTRSLIRRGIRTFTLSFHSPSVEPGHTPYVRSKDDLTRFLVSIERYLEFFIGDLGGASMTPLAFRAALDGSLESH